ncbi:MAG: 4-hydroxythreonine-4-phosphate dehydrogenase PdxA [Candidatus Aminicenantes bacterium]|nr:4-hydroxythreonine-4-phosphate dehydrogenase PdxA [Candidatus Aminicenantes bacterium]
MTVPRIGVTLGDPGGIGPEVALKALAGTAILPAAAYVLFGDPAVIGQAGEEAGIRLAPDPWKPRGRRAAGLFLEPIPSPPGTGGRGAPSGPNGAASFLFFESAVSAVRAGLLDAVVTAPISKTAWRLAGVPWRGHTDYLEHRHPGAVMSFWSERLRVALLSHHVPLSEAVGKVRKTALLEFFRALHRGLQKAPGGPFEILVAGLNPHAGEDGALGREEKEEIQPAVDAASREGIPVSGPYPPDTVFLRARGREKAVVAALYHDQGLIGFKLEAFGSGVNVTLGLPFVRTSPDHGTAFDIAGRGLADPRSMTEALRLAWSFSAAAF